MHGANVYCPALLLTLGAGACRSAAEDLGRGRPSRLPSPTRFGIRWSRRSSLTGRLAPTPGHDAVLTAAAAGVVRGCGAGRDRGHRGPARHRARGARAGGNAADSRPPPRPRPSARRAAAAAPGRRDHLGAAGRGGRAAARPAAAAADAAQRAARPHPGHESDRGAGPEDASSRASGWTPAAPWRRWSRPTRSTWSRRCRPPTWRGSARAARRRHGRGRSTPPCRAGSRRSPRAWTRSPTPARP